MATKSSGTKKVSKKAKDEGIYSLTNTEKDVLGEIGNICMGTSATTLSTLLGKRVTITTPTVSVYEGKDFFKEYDKPLVVAEVSYTEGIGGNNLFLLKRNDAIVITKLLMGSEQGASDDSVKEYYLSAISEVMNQMVGSSATAMAETFHRQIGISPPTVKEIQLGEDTDEQLKVEDRFINISFKMEIEGLLQSNILNLMNFEFAKSLVKLMLEQNNDAAPKKSTKRKSVKPEQTKKNTEKETVPLKSAEVKPMPTEKAENSKIDLKYAKFQSFDDDEAVTVFKSASSNGNIDLIMDVPLAVTVVLGRSKKSIKEILDMGKGSVIVLDRIAGEMVEIMVNGRLFARGEVVVIDESYGVRITELISGKNANDIESGGNSVLLDMDGE